MWPQVIISAIFLAGYMTVLLLFVLGEVKIDPENKTMYDAFLIILGVITAAVPQILNFWLGSSMGSKEKTQGMLKDPLV